MHLRTSLVAVAAVVAAGLLALSGTANATTTPITGSFVSGNASFAGSTYGCTTGSVTGSADDVADTITFSTLHQVCSTPVGSLTVSLNPGCTVVASFPGANNTVIETALAGDAVFGTGTCVKVSSGGGICTYNVQGTVDATFNETTTQNTLTLNGPGTLANQSFGCFGLMTGTFTLNNITFNTTPAVNL
jgi:hypothetical protein